MSPVATKAENVADLLIGAARAAVRDSLSECARAEGQRGRVFLNVELTLGDHGELLYVDSSVYFRRKLHHKDAARERSSG